MRVIFLDIDGVTNCATTPQRWEGFIGMDPVRVKMVNELVEGADIQIVLSSTWRHDKKWRDTMKKNGLIPERLLDRTPSMDGIRGLEIQAWLDEHPEVAKYAIIDDDSDMLPEQMPNFFQTSWTLGLTPEIVNKLWEHFSPDLSTDEKLYKVDKV